MQGSRRQRVNAGVNPRRLHAVTCLALLAAGATLLPAPTARAFWPLTRGVSVQTDSLTESEWHLRFEDWKARSIGTKADAARSPADSVAAALQALREQAAQQGGSPPRLDPAELARLARGERPAATADSVQASAPDDPGGESAAPSQDGFPQVLGDDVVPDPSIDPFDTALSDTTESASDDSLAAAASADALSSAASPQDAASRAAAAAAARAAEARGFAPELRAKLSSTNDRMGLSSSLSTSFTDASGVALSSSITYNDDISLTQNTESETRSIQNTFRLPVESQGLSFSLSTANRRVDRTGTRTVANTRTRDSSEDRTATLRGSVTRQLLQGLSTNAGYSRNFTRNNQDIAAVSGASSGQRERQATGNAYGVGISTDRLSWMKLRARVGRARNGNIDRSPSLASDDNPTGETESTSEGDTASVHLDLKPGGWIPTVNMSWRVSRSTESFTDVTRTATGATRSTTSFELETKTNYSRSFRVSGKLTPFRALNMDFGAEVGRDSTSYAIRANQFRDTRRKSWNLGGSLKYTDKGTLNVKYESRSSDNDQDEPENPRNPQTRVDEERRLTADVNQEITRTLRAHAYGEIRLNQGFYAHPGPQGLGDRDELRTRLGLDLSGRISGKIKANVQMYVRTFDQAFIDSLRSSSSRNETEYVVRQDFNYLINDKVTVSQFYGLSSKVLDEVYNPDRNTLNRNHFLRSRLSYRMTNKLTLSCNFNYLLQDNGLFIVDPFSGSSERFFSPTLRTKKDEIGVGVRYNLIKDGKLVFTSNQQSTRERRTQFSNGEATGTTVTERGNLALGLESKMKLGDLSLDTTLQRNQSFNVNLNNRVFYNVDSSLSYTF